MRRKIVAGNWKMNGDIEFANKFCADLRKRLSGSRMACDVMVAPPAPYLSIMSDAFSDADVTLVAQNVAEYAGGAYTGEVSAAMLKDFGCRAALIGHSERRTLFAESDERVVEKMSRLLEQGIAPILCVGESLEERESGNAKDVVGAQVDFVLSRFSAEQLSNLVIAYEPVWAIGTGKTASPEQAQEMHAHIRNVVAQADTNLSDGMSVLYGGSVNAATAKELFAQPDIDGGLVGGASLKVEDFYAICQSF